MSDALPWAFLVPTGIVASVLALSSMRRSPDEHTRRMAGVWGVLVLMAAFEISYVLPMLAGASAVAEASPESGLLGLVCAAAAQPVGLALSVRATREEREPPPEAR